MFWTDKLSTWQHVSASSLPFLYFMFCLVFIAITRRESFCLCTLCGCRQSFETNDMYALIGVLCGLAIYNFTIIDISLPLALYRKLLKRWAYIEDRMTAVIKRVKSVCDRFRVAIVLGMHMIIGWFKSSVCIC